MRVALVNLLGSSALSQLLIVASTPLLTRVHDRAAFGVFGVATLVALIGATLLSCRLEQSLHVTRDAPERLYSACLSLIALGGALVGLPLALAWRLGGGDEALPTLVFAVGLAVVTASNLMFNRERRFRAIAGIALLIPLVSVGGALAVPDPPGPSNALLFWQATGYTVGALAALWLERRAIRPLAPRALLETVGRARDDLLYLVPSQLLSTASLNMSVAGAAWLFDERVAGLVVVAQRIARMPVSVLGNSLNEVLRAAIPERREILRTFDTVVALTALGSVLMLLAVWLLPERVYALVLGEGWQGLGEVLAITAVAACFQLVSTSVASMLTAFRKRVFLVVNAALFAAGALALGAGAAFGLDPIGYLWAHSIGAAVVYSAAFVECRAVAIAQTPRRPIVR